jgi:drug/metabolite transporter (DMT)-like permease
MANKIENTALGVKYMLLASFLFAIMAVFVKLLSEFMSPVETVFFRNIFGVLIIIISIYKSPIVQKGGKFWLLMVRGLLGFTAVIAYFYNMATIPIGEAMVFSKTAPIFTAFFAFVFLREKLNLIQWIAILLGFFGIILIMQPEQVGALDSSINSFLGVLSGLGAGLAYTSIRELKNYYDSRSIVLSFMGVGSLGPIILFLIAELTSFEALDFMIYPFIIPTSTEIWCYILAMGILATISQVLMTKAYGEAKAGLISAIGYSGIVFSTIFGIIFFDDDFPTYIGVIGTILIVFSGLLIVVKKIDT